MKPHKHAELIKAWADGAEIEMFRKQWGDWATCNPTWYEFEEYRIKPEPKPDVICKAYATKEGTLTWIYKGYGNFKLIFDGESGELKSAEVLK